jgi:methylenetetrahydrofolate dehydrogenase (NADP+)/methenyltetrahydrofolate cyclohydrolase
MKLLEGKVVSQAVLERLRSEIAALKAAGKPAPFLVAILVGTDSASESYVSSKKKRCDDIGMDSAVIRLPETVSQEELLRLVNKYNTDPRCNGILVQLPLPKHIDENAIINAINPEKDVDGFHPVSIGRLMLGIEGFVSCTPAGIHEMIKHYNIETKGKHVVVVGRSNIVGKPIANILLQKKPFANAVVTVCHSAAKDITKYTKDADILIAAIGSPLFIKEDMVKEGVVVIDVGINRVPDASRPKGYRVVGDVDFENVAPKADFITPVPGGVGLTTVALLLQNTMLAYKQQNKV